MLIIDRFEGDYAVCEEDGAKMRNIPRSLLPPGAKEGDVLAPEGGRFRVDEQGTQARRRRIDGLMKDIFDQ
ncbi:MAG: DUF3006 domain-containing protein [Clostridia bacterium]|nr:DUF3006 domain-containing protein [Clostridia bacterium]MDR3644850.1 DUF3006 domain-containing protein [Clostridia bacterium]